VFGDMKGAKVERLIIYRAYETVEGKTIREGGVINVKRVNTSLID
jgi:hypothetical protein